jgi:hypothetical protein
MQASAIAGGSDTFSTGAVDKLVEKPGRIDANRFQLRVATLCPQKRQPSAAAMRIKELAKGDRFRFFRRGRS